MKIFVSFLQTLIQMCTYHQKNFASIKTYIYIGINLSHVYKRKYSKLIITMLN